MSNEIVKFSNQFNNVALKKFDAVHLDVLMAIASRVREKGTATVEFSFEELRGLMRLRKNLTNKQLADKIVQTNARLLALNYMFEDSGKIIQFALFTKFVTDPQEATLAVGVNEEFAFLLNDLTSQFTRFELAEFADLKSKYAKEFYRRGQTIPQLRNLEDQPRRVLPTAQRSQIHSRASERSQQTSPQADYRGVWATPWTEDRAPVRETQAVGVRVHVRPRDPSGDRRQARGGEEDGRRRQGPLDERGGVWRGVHDHGAVRRDGRA